MGASVSVDTRSATTGRSERTEGGQGSAVSRVRWLQIVAVITAAFLLMASSCSWQLGIPIPEGVPPPEVGVASSGVVMSGIASLT